MKVSLSLTERTLYLRSAAHSHIKLLPGRRVVLGQHIATISFPPALLNTRFPICLNSTIDTADWMSVRMSSAAYFLLTSKPCICETQGARSSYSLKIDTPITKLWAICKCFSPAISRIAYKVYKQAFWASFALSPEIFASVLVPSGGALFHRGRCCLCV